MIDNDNKGINANKLFCTGYSLFLIGQILGHTFINVTPNFRYALIFIGFTLILMKIILFDSITLTIKSVFKLIFMIFFLIVSLVSAKNSLSIIPIATFLLIVGARKVNFDNILEIFMYTAITLLVITFTFYFLGLINESTASRGGVIRHSFGYRYPTDLVSMISYLLMADMYRCIKYKKLIYPRIVSYILFGFFTLKFCDARLGSATIFIFIPAILLLRYRAFFLQYKWMKFIDKNSFILCTIIAICVTQLFMTHANAILIKLDQLTSYRLTYQVIATKLFGYSAWGQEVYQNYIQLMGNNSWFFIDSSYYIFLIQYGFVLMAIFAIFFYFAQKSMLHKGEYIIPFLFLIICMNGLIEQHFYTPEYNVFLLSFMSIINTKNYSIFKGE
ncbi:hypothetical protein [Limosilactobacillus reuteri]|uniref:hypothetical protein n=1 Tax=Limosilactobacillus reuteri TaxID=1598 RepID=UPI000A1E1330|nr:hypothetical protein [Limosilactobacillus reuteri]